MTAKKKVLETLPTSDVAESDFQCADTYSAPKLINLSPPSVLGKTISHATELTTGISVGPTS